MSDERAAWRERQRRAASVHGAAEERRLAAEAERARALIAEFVREAGELGLRPSALTAAPYRGGARYRTRLRGWYLRRDRSVAVGTDGEFYLLTVPASLRARVLGADPAPDRPRLVVGQGARDGESMPLDRLLRQRLDAGDDWP
jgi:hypothetical protein